MKTTPGLVNLSVLVIATVGIFSVGAIEALEGLVRAFRGEAGPGFPPTVIVVAVILLAAFCVSILVVADRLKSPPGD